MNHTAIFLAVTVGAMLMGTWHNQIPRDEYLRRFERLDSPMYQLDRGQVSKYRSED